MAAKSSRARKYDARRYTAFSREGERIMVSIPEDERCGRCEKRLSAEAIKAGWPISAANGESICPDCYGDEAHCGDCGAVLPADEESEVCSACISGAA